MVTMTLSRWEYNSLRHGFAMEISSGRIILKSQQLHRSRGRLMGSSRFYEFDPVSRELRGNSSVVQRLTGQEARVLILLISKAREAVSREAIESTVWGREPPFDSDQRINDLILRLRRALHDSPKKGEFIETIPGFGYKFVGGFECPAVMAMEPAI